MLKNKGNLLEQLLVVEERAEQQLAENNKLTELIRDLRLQLKRLKAEIQKGERKEVKKEDVTRLKSDLEGARASLAHEWLKFRELNSEFGNARSNYHIKMRDMEASLEVSRSNRRQLATQLAAVQSELEIAQASRTKLAVVKGELVSVKKEKSQLADELAAGKGELVSVKKEKSQLADELAAGKGELVSVKKEKSQLADELAAVKGELVSVKKEKSQLADELAAVRRQLAASQAKLKAANETRERACADIESSDYLKMTGLFPPLGSPGSPGCGGNGVPIPNPWSSDLAKEEENTREALLASCARLTSPG